LVAMARFFVLCCLDLLRLLPARLEA